MNKFEPKSCPAIKDWTDLKPSIDHQDGAEITHLHKGTEHENNHIDLHTNCNERGKSHQNFFPSSHVSRLL